MTNSIKHPNVVVLSGGVGGARMVHGLHQVLPPDRLSIIVNTGDDFVHTGLRICPDLDTVLYTLAGLAPEERGWGVDGDSFAVLDQVAAIGGPSWFRLGDRDLATHLTRTHLLGEGQSLTYVTAKLAAGLDVTRRILPMCDSPRPTVVRVAAGDMSFQDWLVRERGLLPALSIRSDGPTTMSPSALAAIDAADLVVIAPSNPYVSIGPILTLDGVRDAVRSKPVVAVSPIIAGRAVKGPLAAMMQSIDGVDPTASNVAAMYGDIIDAFVCDPRDAPIHGRPTLAVDVMIQTAERRARLANQVLAFFQSGWDPLAGAP